MWSFALTQQIAFVNETDEAIDILSFLLLWQMRGDVRVMDLLGSWIFATKPAASSGTQIDRWWLYTFGILLGINFLAVVVLFLLKKTKLAELASMSLGGIFVLFFVLSGFFILGEQAVSLSGERNGILAISVFVLMVVLLWVFAIKALLEVEKHDTVKKLSVWVYIFAFLVSFIGLLWLMFKLLLTGYLQRH